MKKVKHKNRGTWLVAAVAALRPFFDEQGCDDYPKVRVSCGFPKYRAKAIGQCWSASVSGDKTYEIFISPELDGAHDVLATLLHELVHAVVGVECGHKGPFRKLAKAVGLEGRMTATVAGEELTIKLAGVSGKLGPYPHAKLSVSRANKQSTRMLKIRCKALDCDCVVRMTRTWLDRVGAPVCGCGFHMEEA